MTIVFKVSDNIKPLMMEFYKDRMLDKKPPYSVFQVKEYDCVITLYESGKAMFQGIGADIEASYWIEEERIKNGRIIDITTGKDKKNTPETRILFNESTIGSDEVGTGDFFGPIVVTATYVSKEDISSSKFAISTSYFVIESSIDCISSKAVDFSSCISSCLASAASFLSCKSSFWSCKLSAITVVVNPNSITPARKTEITFLFILFPSL